MKISKLKQLRVFLLILLCFIYGSAGALAQKQALITINLENVSIKTIFKAIETQTPYKLSFRENAIKDKSKVSINMTDATIDKVLNHTLKGTSLSYKILPNNSIVISEKKQTAKKGNSTLSGPEKVRGTVVGEDGEPIIGASVRINNSNSTATVTDHDGRFSIPATNGDVISISYIGYETKEFPVKDQTSFDIKLKQNVEVLNDIVVIGYGTQRKADVTTAVASISTDDLDSRLITSAANAIQGRAAGVQVVQPSGMPGTTLSIRVRGATSVEASNEPLYVVDGITQDDISNLSVNDIETIQVLKDASSSAIYGARAANGVVLITTKRGSSKGASIKFDAYGGFSRLSKTISALNTQQYKVLMSDLAKVTDAIPEIPENENRYTDWSKVLFQTGISQNYQLAISNGNAPVSYFISGGYTDEKGIVNKAYFRRVNFRANMDSDVLDWLSIQLSTAYSNTNGRSVNESRSSMRSGSILGVINTPPFMHIWNNNNPEQYDEEAYGARISNPMAANAADMTYSTDRFVGALALRFNILKGLNFKTMLSVDINNGRDDYYLDPVSTTDGRSTKGSVSEGTSRNFEWTWENTLNYNQKFNNRYQLTGVAGAILQRAQFNSSNIAGFDLPESYPELHSVGVANQINPDNTWTYASSWSLASFLGRINFIADDKYLITANMRADGSSRFAPGHRWGVFPSVSAGWRISSESFMSETRGFLNDLKIRGSWGMNGNQGGIGNHAWRASMRGQRVPPSTTNSYPGLAITQSTSGNTELTWEKTSQVNIGFDATLFNSRLIIGFDAYYKKTNDMLLTVALPDNVNLPGGITRNDGGMINKGIEFNISSRNLIGDLKWSTEFNMSFNRNEVTHLGLNKVYYYANSYTTGEPAVILRAGLPLGSFFGYISQGVDPETGDIMYADLNNNGILDPNDRTVIGSAQPDFTYGMTNTLSWKNFDLSIFIQGSQGNDIFNASRIETEGMFDFRNQSTNVLRRWVRPGMETDMPRAGNIENIHNSSRFIEDGSYIRLKSLTLAYSFTQRWIKKAHMSKLRLYATADNLITLTHYSGYCPEVNAYGTSAVALGVDYGTYPQARTFVFGVNVEF